MMIDLNQLKSDREAGTDGPWRLRENAGHDPERCDITICGDIFQLADINGPQYVHQEANARRIARLPELEDAYIEAVAKLDKAVEALKNIRDIEKPMFGEQPERDWLAWYSTASQMAELADDALNPPHNNPTQAYQPKRQTVLR